MVIHHVLSACSDLQTASGADIHVVAAPYNVRIVHEDVVVIVVIVLFGLGPARRGVGGGVESELFVLVGRGILDENIEVVLEVVELVVVGVGVELAQGRILI